jgi:hypothetical protein
LHIPCDSPRLCLHDLWKTYASLLAKASVPIEVMAKHRHSSTVDRYFVLYRDRDEAAASAFERLVGLTSVRGL